MSQRILSRRVLQLSGIVIAVAMLWMLVPVGRVSADSCDDGIPGEQDPNPANSCVFFNGDSLSNQFINNTSCNFDWDWWRVFPNAGHTISVVVDNQSAFTSNFILHIRDSAASSTDLGTYYNLPNGDRIAELEGVPFGTTYWVGVENTVREGSCGAMSHAYNITMSWTAPLSAPTNFQARFTSATNVLFTWQDNSSDENGFWIQRSPNGTDSWTDVATFGGPIVANQTNYTYTDNSLVCGTTLHFRIRAFRNSFSPVSSNWAGPVSAVYDCPSISPDSFEENDTSGNAKPIGANTSLDLTIAPSNDPDFFFFFGQVGTFSIQAASSLGLSLDLTLIAPNGTVVASSGNSVTPSISGALPTNGYYTLSVEPSIGSTTLVARYRLIVSTTPAMTNTPTPTITPLPTTIGPDVFEPNDTEQTAKQINRVSELTLTIAPAGNVDYFYFLGVPGPANLSAYSSLGMNLNMTLTGPSGTIVATNNGTPNPTINTTLTINGFYIIKVEAATGGPNLGYYQLNVSNAPPGSTATPGPTSTAAPTATLTPTPDLGGPPDIAEKNNQFASAFRIAPGNSITLNFNSGTFGVEDVDYFAMTVKEGIEYTCETFDLGLGTDTILYIYGPAPDPSNLIASHDDLDTSTGIIRSQITWKSGYNGQAYILVTQNGPLSYPGAATYDLSCYVGKPTVATGSTGGGGGSASSSGESTILLNDEELFPALSVQIVDAPEREEEATPAPPGTLVIDIVIAYDENENQLVDLIEGVSGISVRAIDTKSNTQIANGFTDEQGSLHLIVTGEQGTDVLVVIPFLSVGRTFQIGVNTSESWQVLLAASNLPGIIP